MKHLETQFSPEALARKLGRNLRLGAFVAVGLVVSVTSAMASETIWGRNPATGDLITEKVTLTKPMTITSVSYEGRGGPGFCIWAGVPIAEKVVCWWDGNPSLVGTVLPADIGYFAIPGKATNNTPAYVQIIVE